MCTPENVSLPSGSREDRLTGFVVVCMSISICEIRAKDTRARRGATNTQQRSQYLWLLLLLLIVVDVCFCCLFILQYIFYMQMFNVSFLRLAAALGVEFQNARAKGGVILHEFSVHIRAGSGKGGK